MNLRIATHKPTGLQYFYRIQRLFGETRYSADCSAACVGEGAIKPTWHRYLSEARKSATERGTLQAATDNDELVEIALKIAAADAAGNALRQRASVCMDRKIRQILEKEACSLNDDIRQLCGELRIVCFPIAA